MLLWEAKFWHLQQAGGKQNLARGFEPTIIAGLRVSGTLTAHNEEVSQSFGKLAAKQAPTARHESK